MYILIEQKKTKIIHKILLKYINKMIILDINNSESVIIKTLIFLFLKGVLSNIN